MSKIKDGIIGHAIGDAMGVPVEFKDRESLIINPVIDMRVSRDGNKGTWSDDTSMEIATIDSYINNLDWNYDDIMTNFFEWINSGKYTARNYTFDVGRTCLTAITKYVRKNIPALECGLDDINSNGNGSLMRILPVAYYCFYRKLDRDKIYEYVKNISSLTHRHEISILGCYIYVLYVIELLNGKDKYEAYKNIKLENYSYFDNKNIDVYRRILKDDIGNLKIDDINSSGYIVDTLESSLWIIMKTNNYKEAILDAVNLGGDTDTIAAVTGSIAGLIYGYNSIPKEWLNHLARREYIEELCDKFEKAVINNVN